MPLPAFGRSPTSGLNSGHVTAHFFMRIGDYMDLVYEKKYIRALCAVKGLNGRMGKEIIDHMGSASNVFSSDLKTLSELLTPGIVKGIVSAGSLIDSVLPENMNFTTVYEDEYPKRLREIPGAPLGIWHIGALPAEDLPSVAIIGARQCSPYGEHVAKALGEYLGKAGVQVVSGMARGIDGISQKAALENGGTSFGVLGSGADVCYPPSNKMLYEKLKQSGGIISEYPPGEKALPANFPPRNRIVSGLSDAVVVVEARQKSGTLITVDTALEQGREIYAVPGRVTDRLSDGCNSLIGQGANVFLSPEIFICELMEIFESKASNRTKRIPACTFSPGTNKRHKSFSGKTPLPAGLSPDEENLLSLLSLSPMTTDELCLKIPGSDYPAISMALMQLLIDGHVKQVSQGAFVRTYK